MQVNGYGIILIAFGAVYIIRPNIFRVGFWKKTDVAQQIFTPKQYALYMRIPGVVFILIGSYLMIPK